jgi:hypothetical protein
MPKRPVIAIAVLLWVSGCSAGARPSTDERLVKLDEPNAISATTIAGVLIRGGYENGLGFVVLQSTARTETVPLTRGAKVYVSEPDARFAVVQDCFASDEDRLLLFDMHSKAPAVAVAHEGDGYSHQHFQITGMADGAARATEFEWAGETPPRQRLATISLGPNGYAVRYGPWSPTPL